MNTTMSLLILFYQVCQADVGTGPCCGDFPMVEPMLEQMAGLTFEPITEQTAERASEP